MKISEKMNAEFVEIERKAMIKNRYNYLSSSVQDTEEKERTESNGTTIKTLQAESKKKKKKKKKKNG